MSMPMPTIVTPNSGPTSGGTSVRVDGTNFVAGATVLFGGSPATNVSVSGGGTVITCATPARTSGFCDIVVINPDGQSGSLASGFMYSDPVPTVTAVTPPTGPTAGGTVVTITGTNFAAGAMVSFGAMPATGITVASSTTIHCSTPPHLAGGCDVMVTNPSGQTATLTAGFVYNNPLPTIVSVTPATGPTAGGTLVMIAGTNFSSGATVNFGGVPASAVNVTGTIISCTTPPHAAGGCDVTVSHPDGQTATLTAGFVYSNPVPTIASLTPPTGPTAGGTSVTVTGTNFAAGAMVNFGTSPATGVTVASDTTIHCSTPPHIAGGCDVIVTNINGQTATLTAGFIYSDPAPVIASVTPATGPTAGGTMATITGTNFAAGAAVSFGAMPATGITVVSNTTIHCSTPPHIAGGCNVMVTNPGGQTATLTAGFVYSDPVPVIASVTPATGPTAGGTLVMIAGTNFSPGATVNFGGVPAAAVNVTGTIISCTTPPHSMGGCDVRVTNPDGQTATLAAGFIYSDPVPTVTAVTPPTGPTAGGTPVTITGTNFAAGATVSFGAMPATGAIVVSETTIHCSTPPHIAGGCDVLVTNTSGQAATLTGGFIYSDPVPVITSVTPTTGPTAGGTQVMIAGTNFSPGATVNFGGVPAATVNVTGTIISCTTPPHSMGGCDVTVTNPDGQTATLAAGFIYSDPVPTVATVTPPTGPAAGGTAVTITGTNFAAGATVSFGAMPAIGVMVTADNMINCTTPANAAGTVDVIVFNPNGSSATLSAGFTFS